MRRALALLVLTGCGQQAADVGEVLPSPTIDWEKSLIYGVPNLDDDDGNGEPDWDDEGPDGENDFTTVPLDAVTYAVQGGEVVLSLSGEGVRLWKDGKIWLTDGKSKTFIGNTFEVEFEDSLYTAELTVDAYADGELVDSSVWTLIAAPHILNNHLQEAELVVAMDAGNGNAEFIEGFEDVLGDRFLAVPYGRYGYDVWVQDEIELGTLTAPDKRVDIVIDSIRSGRGQYLDDFPEDVFEAPDFARKTWGRGQASSQDSFGNLEVSPPLTVDGVEYPFGRMYWGEWYGEGPQDTTLLTHLEDQVVQKPFTIDVSFLCVGHVDEITTFLPDPTAPRGFRFIIGDVDEAWTFLESLDPGMELPKYSRYKDFDTVGDVLDDAALVALNDGIQEDYLDPALEIFIEELGLTDEEIIRFPALFERNSYCGSTTAAFIPGTVNMTVAQMPEDDTVHAFMPDPFFREDDDTSDAARAEDPFIAHIESLLPAGIEPHWLDDWNTYHMGLGEVHCGSNTQRTPAGEWWNDATHLIEPLSDGGR